MLFSKGRVMQVCMLAAALASAAGCRTEARQVVLVLDAGGDGPRGDAFVREPAPDRCDTPPIDLRANGSPCACGQACQSGLCVDGVCCNSACTGTCQRCNLPDRPGLCGPIPAGLPPAVPGQCQQDPVAGCGLDGTCDGNGGCRKYPDGTECQAGTCQGNAVVGAKICQGGSCREGSNTFCSPYGCDTSRGRCFARCSDGSQCDGRECKDTSCGKKPLGAVCGDASECASGSCADGVCCNLPCSGACFSCNQVGKMGACSPTAAGSPDPHGVCKSEPRAGCGMSGTCNGQGGCAKYAAGTECRPGSCSGGSEIPMSVCDGAGTCVLGAPVACAPFVCAQNACKGSCASNADCTGGNLCLEGSCGKKQNGQSCRAGSECRTGFCVDGFCCDTACGGTCVFCGFPSSRGRCTNSPAGVPDPRAACDDEGEESCGTNGNCNGNRGCQRYPSGTPCRAGSCDQASNRETQTGTCSGGRCAVPASTSCAPFRCNGAACGSSCAGDAQCAAPAVCQNNSCGKKPLGALCAGATECQSSFCAQGVCCASACTASCFACNQAGQAGTCAPVAAGAQDPAGQCRDDGPASCQTDGVCDGQGACRRYAPGTICRAASCSAGQRTLVSTCDGAGSCQTGATQACAPFVCNQQGTDCFSSCTDSGQCQPPNQCDGNGRCGTKANGSSCSEGGECTSGFCVEGVCCGSSVCTTCKSCAVPGALGTCTNVVDGGNDPLGRCPPAPESSCGNDGRCNGGGACRLWSAGTPCRGASCPAGTSVLSMPAFCDGNGTCPASATQPCTPFKCDGAASACRQTCSGDDDCSMGVCGGGSCGKKALGAGCTGGSECGSGNCVDGACCASATCGTCQSCGNAQGTCANVGDDGTDPDSCSDQTGVNPCGTTGRCDGNGVCKLRAQGQSCGAVCAAGGTAVQARACNGAGACQDSSAPPESCSPFVCDDGVCRTSCDAISNAGCASGKVCLNGSCVDPPLPDAGVDDTGP
jgi:hypothetical protein